MVGPLDQENLRREGSQVAIYEHKCQACGEINVFDRKPAEKIEVICSHCGATMTVGGRGKSATVAAAVEEVVKQPENQTKTKIKGE